MKKIISFLTFSLIITVLIISAVSFVPNTQAQNIASLQNIVASGFSFKKDLRLGDTDPDAVQLQKVLNADIDTMVATDGTGSPGFESTYFGPATKAAVIKFQNKYRSVILTPAGLTVGSGDVDKLTRTKLNLLIGVLNTSDSVGFPQSRTPTSVSTSVSTMVATRPAVVATSQRSMTACQLVELLINIDAIHSDKANPARQAFGCPGVPPQSMSTCQFVELLINIGAIAPDKAVRARSALNCSATSQAGVNLLANGYSDSITVPVNSVVNLSWSSSGVSSCSIASVSKPLSGLERYTVTASRTFNISCRTATGATVVDSVIVRVSQPIPTPDNQNNGNSPYFLAGGDTVYGTSSARFIINTNVPTKVYITYRTGTSAPTTYSSTTLSAARTETITGLTPSTTYFSIIKIVDAAGHEYSSAELQGATAGLPAVVVDESPVINTNPIYGAAGTLQSVLGATTTKHVASSTSAEETAGYAVQGGIGYPDIAVDTLGQPHILAQVGLGFPNLDAASGDNNSAFNLYSKIANIWKSIVPLDHEVGGPKRPEIEIDANDQAWISGMTFVSPSTPVEEELVPGSAEAIVACGDALVGNDTTVAQPADTEGPPSPWTFQLAQNPTVSPVTAQIGGYFQSINYCMVRSKYGFADVDHWDKLNGSCSARNGSMVHRNPNYIGLNCRPDNDWFDPQCECDIYFKDQTRGIINIKMAEPLQCTGTTASFYFDSNTQISPTPTATVGISGRVITQMSSGAVGEAAKPLGCVFPDYKGSSPGNPIPHRTLGLASTVLFDAVADAEAIDSADRLASAIAAGDYENAQTTAAEAAAKALDMETRIPYVGDWVGLISGMSSAPALSWFQMIRPYVGSFVGNVAIDPYVPDTAWHMGIQPNATTKFTSYGTFASERTMSPGQSGEKIIFRIAPQASSTGIWHAAMGGFSRESSSYINSTMGSKVVWADYNKYPRQGNDMSYIDLGIDWNKPKVAYIAGSYDGVVINIWDGSRFIFPANSLYVVDSSPAEFGNGATRWSPKWSPALGGGAYLCWTGGDGNVKLKYISSAGTSSFGPTTVIGAGNQCNIATDYNGDVHVTYMKNGNVEYRKITMKHE